MYRYEYYLKDDTRKVFFTDSPFVPEEIEKFCKEQGDNITSSFCDHFPVTVEEYISQIEINKDSIICR